MYSIGCQQRLDTLPLKRIKKMELIKDFASTLFYIYRVIDSVHIFFPFLCLAQVSLHTDIEVVVQV